MPQPTLANHERRISELEEENHLSDAELMTVRQMIKIEQYRLQARMQFTSKWRWVLGALGGVAALAVTASSLIGIFLVHH